MTTSELGIIGGFQSLQISSNEDDLRGIFDAVVAIYRQWELFCGHQVPMLLCLPKMPGMSKIYRHQLGSPTSRIDFSNVCTRWAYMYVYMLRHVHLALHAWDLTLRERIVTVTPGGTAQNVCMVGGGPGSDVLSFAMFLSKYGVSCPLLARVDVLDRCTAWVDSWNSLSRHLPEKYKRGIPSVSYHAFDYLENELSETNREIVRTADLVTMIKSLSPVAAWLKGKQPKTSDAGAPDDQSRDSAISEWHSVYSIMENMRPGALLFYMDNKTGPQREILMDATKCLNFQVLFDRLLRGVSLPNGVFSQDAKRLMVQLNGYKPCSHAGTNEVILLRKI